MNWLLDNLVERVVDARHAVVLSADGLLIGKSLGLSRDDSDQLSAMASLHRHGPMTPGELATCERVQPPSMTKVIAALTERGFVDRSPHPTDGRQTVVALTDAGRDYVDAEVSARERWLDAQLAQLTPDERALLHPQRPLVGRLLLGGRPALVGSPGPPQGP